MKKVDANGFWHIEDNPISKEGIYPYYGRQISPELEPDKIYKVFRPREELRKAADTFKNVPILNDHTMVGKDFTPMDDLKEHGVLGEKVYEKDGTLYSNIVVRTDELKNLITNGKKELSMGYQCQYDLTPGIWHGQKYDAVQRDLIGNHVALVNNGRMGHDVRVMDSKDAIYACDSFDIKETEETEKEDLDSTKSNGASGTDADPEKESKEMDKREAIREIMAISAKPVSEFAGGEEEKVETIAKLAEQIAYKPSEAGTNDEGAKVESTENAKDACAKDATREDKRKLIDEIGGILKGKVDEELWRTIIGKAEKLAYEDSEASADDEDVKPEDKEGKKALSMDEMEKELIKRINAKNALAEKLKPFIGTFDHNDMTIKDMAAYACEKLGKKVACDEALTFINGYLEAAKKPAANVVMDEAPAFNKGSDEAFEAFLKGE